MSELLVLIFILIALFILIYVAGYERGLSTGYGDGYKRATEFELQNHLNTVNTIADALRDLQKLRN